MQEGGGVKNEVRLSRFCTISPVKVVKIGTVMLRFGNCEYVGVFTALLNPARRPMFAKLLETLSVNKALRWRRTEIHTGKCSTS